MNGFAKPQDNTRGINLGREEDFSLGSARIHPSTCEVQVAGRREIVQPRAMQVLVVLARATGAVVSRDRLIELCWEGRVIGDDAIDRAIAKVRAAAELSNPPAFQVETIPRVGFRLKVGQEPVTANALPSNLIITENGSDPALRATLWTRHRYAIVALAAMALVFAALLLWLREPVPRQVPKSSEASIAVLPFVNMSGDPTKEYLSEGFSEELLNDLANTPQLRVAARTSSFSFKNKNATVQDIAKKLHVRSVLEGSVRESSDRVRITAQLIDAASGFHIWSQTYDRDLGDVLRLQDEIARAIVASLTRRLLSANDSPVAHVRPRAYRAFLLGKFYFDRRNDTDNKRAIGLLREATMLQPDFAEAHAMLGYAYLQDISARLALPPPQEFQQLEAALRRALALDPNNVTALYVSMYITLSKEDWNAAGDIVRKLLAASRTHPFAIRAKGFYDLAMGFPDRALKSLVLATRLDPLSAAAWQNLIGTLIAAGRSREAIEAGEIAAGLKLEGAHLTGELCAAYATGGRLNAAKSMEARIAGSDDRASSFYCRFYVALAAHDFTAAGATLDAFANTAASLNIDAESMTELYILLDDRPKALAWARRSYEAGDFQVYGLPYERQLPRQFFQTAEWKELTQRPRFRAWQAAHDRLAAELAGSP